jgi:hypothetical protein
MSKIRQAHHGGSTSSERPLYQLLLRPEPGIDPVLGLRALLKLMLRAWGFRCLCVTKGAADSPWHQ